MTITRVLSSPIAFGASDAPNGASFRSISGSTVSDSTTVVAAAPDGMDWLRIYRPLSSGPARYFVCLDHSSSARDTRDTDAAARLGAASLHSFTLDEGVTVRFADVGFYSDADHPDDGHRDILLTLSDGTQRIIRTGDERDERNLVTSNAGAHAEGPPTSPGGATVSLPCSLVPDTPQPSPRPSAPEGSSPEVGPPPDASMTHGHSERYAPDGTDRLGI